MSLLRRIGLYGVLAAILMSIALPAAGVYAQSAPPPRPPLNLMTSPLPLNVVTKPGVPVKADIRIKNNGAQPEQLKVDLLKFGASGESGQPQLLERKPQDLFFNWAQFSETNFTAEPNVWKTIQMTISPPKEAAFGYYYAVVFSRASPQKAGPGQSSVEGGVASLVLLNVDAPGSRREAKVVSLSASQKVYEFLPSNFTIKLRNTGNIHVAPTGTMFIKRGGTQVAAMDFNSERGNILPGTNRVFNMTWADGFPTFVEKEVNGKKTRSLEWDFSKIQKLRFGRYTANLVAVYDDGQRDVPIEAIVSFWVIPWRILGVILLIVLFILLGLWGMGRLIWKGIRRQAATGPNAALPVSDTPDPSSLAAAPRRSQRIKKSIFRPKTPKTPKTPKQEKTPKRPKQARAKTSRGTVVNTPVEYEDVPHEPAPIKAKKANVTPVRQAPARKPAAKVASVKTSRTPKAAPTAVKPKSRLVAEKPAAVRPPAKRAAPVKTPARKAITKSAAPEPLMSSRISEAIANAASLQAPVKKATTKPAAKKTTKPTAKSVTKSAGTAKVKSPSKTTPKAAVKAPAKKAAPRKRTARREPES